MKMPRKWWKLGLTILALLVAMQIGVSLAVGTRRMHAYLTAQLEKAFGRPVEVGHFAVQLLPAPRLDAEQITVGEDPAFGNEYFLRADNLSAGLRWSGLLLGHFEFGTLSLSRPSLILVRNNQGKWNLERWLPPPKSSAETNTRVYGPPSAIAPVNRLLKIDFDDGRINFKNTDDKLPFALTGVSGSVDQIVPGRWQLRLEAQPWRSGVVLQSAGTVRVRGDIAGTSVRLQPAQINVHWEEVSLADLFRLLSGRDHGMRGVFTLDGSLKSGTPDSGSSASASNAAGRMDFFAGSTRGANPSLGFDRAQRQSEATAWRQRALERCRRKRARGRSDDRRAAFESAGRSKLCYRPGGSVRGASRFLWDSSERSARMVSRVSPRRR